MSLRLLRKPQSTIKVVKYFRSVKMFRIHLDVLTSVKKSKRVLNSLKRRKIAVAKSKKVSKGLSELRKVFEVGKNLEVCKSL